jgi:predicted Zn-ribbon and HTH transcriptional regulator
MQCPACGSARVHSSRLRGFLERLRQVLTGMHPVRCHQCGWRRWQNVIDRNRAPIVPDDLRTGRAAAPLSNVEIDQIDTIPRRS